MVWSSVISLLGIIFIESSHIFPLSKFKYGNIFAKSIARELIIYNKSSEKDFVDFFFS